MISSVDLFEQKGSVLVFLMILLTGISALWVSSLGSVRLMSGGADSIVSQDGVLLFDARQSLLSYSALYPFLYGPRGAGPGHLPCPDTDGNQNPAIVSVVLDGPNPPCGSNPVARGRLPRHILLSEQRYLFHNESVQRATYHVASAFINNPTNRIMNSGVPDRTDDGALKVAARLATSGSDVDTPSGAVPVFQKTMMQGIKPAVAAWLIDKASGRTGEPCGEYQPCALIPRTDPECIHNEVLSLIVDTAVSDERCLEDKLDEMTIDGVPALRHWFVRNQWLDWIHVTVSAECMEHPVQPCALVYKPTAERGQPDSDHRFIAVRWLP